MMEKEEKVISLTDISRLHRRVRKKLLRGAFFSGAFLFLLSTISSVKYPVEATFKESHEGSDSASSFKSLLGNLGGGAQEAQAADIMKSRKILSQLIAKLGLQVTAVDRTFFQKVKGRMKDNLLAQLKRPLKDRDSFRFENVTYLGESPKTLFVKFISEEMFTVFDENGESIGITHLKKPFSYGDVTFSLSKTPSSLKLDKIIPISFRPIKSVIRELQGGIHIAENKNNSSLFTLSYQHRDRHLAVDILNQLMDEYQKYLKQDHDKLAEAQLDYLVNRQKLLSGNLEEAFSSHASYLKDNLKTSGFLGLQQEIQGLMEPHQKLLDKISHLEMEENRLGELKEGKFALLEGSPISDSYMEIQRAKENYQHEKDLLDLSLNFDENNPLVQKKRELSEKIREIDAKMLVLESTKAPLSVPEFQNLCDMKRALVEEKHTLESKDLHIHTCKMDDLERVRENLKEAKEVFTRLQKGKGVDVKELSFDSGKVVESLLFRFREDPLQKEEFGQDLTRYLENTIHLLSMREKILQEKIFHTKDVPQEFEGIDLETAKKLYIGYTNKLDEAEREIRHLDFLQKRMEDPAFETTSLSTTLKDPISTNIIEKISQLLLDLRDEKNLHDREKDRKYADLSLQRSFLKNHISEMASLKKLNAELFQRKIESLKCVRLDRLNQKISVLDEQMEDAVLARKKGLAFEKTQVEKNLSDLKKKMLSIPKKWHIENSLKLKMEMGLNMMQAMTQLVESKTISHHLHRVQSHPLDFASAPLLPNSSKMLSLTFMGILLGYFGLFFYWLLRSLVRGFPLSGDTLKTLGKHFSGNISSDCDGKKIEHIADSDLETLRRMMMFAGEEKGAVLSLIGAKGPNYSFTLADLFAKKGYKILLMQCTFGTRFSKQDIPGVLGYLKKEVKKPPIRKEKNYDLMTSGGTTRYGAEILGSHDFKKLIEDSKKNYDMVIIYSKALPAFAEARELMSITDKTVVTIKDETADDLGIFLDKETSYSLSFVTV